MTQYIPHTNSNFQTKSPNKPLPALHEQPVPRGETTLNINEAQLTIKTLKLVADALDIGFNQFFQECSNSPGVRKICAGWHKAILKTLIEKKTNTTIEIHHNNLCVELTEDGGSTVIPIGMDEFKLEGRSIDDILDKLIEEILVQPGNYDSDDLQCALNQVILIDRCKPSFATELAIKYVCEHLNEVSSELKFGVAECMFQQINTHNPQDVLKIAECIVCESKTDQSASFATTLDSILTNPDNYQSASVWAAVLCTICDKNSNCDSALFRKAAAIIVQKKKDCPSRIAVAAAIQFVRENAKEDKGNEGFFAVSSLDQAALKAAFSGMAKRKILKEYSDGLRTVLCLDKTRYGFTDDMVRTNNEKKFTKRIDVEGLWIERNCEIALKVSAHHKDIAMYILEKMDDDAVKSWKSREVVPRAAKPSEIGE